MARRVRKYTMIASLRLKALAYKLTPEQVDTFERMYRRARNEAEQDEVTRAVNVQIDGWKTATNAFARVLQNASDLGELADDEDPPEMKAVLARASRR